MTGVQDGNGNFFFNQEENMIRLIRPLFLNIVKIVKNRMTADQEGNAIFRELKISFFTINRK